MIKLAITIGCLEIGGAEIFILNLLKRLNYQKYQVLLIVLSKNPARLSSRKSKIADNNPLHEQKRRLRSAGVNQNYRASVAVFPMFYTGTSAG